MFILLALILLVLYLIPTYVKPHIVTDVITKEERDYILNKANEQLQPSQVSAKREINTKLRKSETAWIDTNDPVVSKIIDRCIQFTDRPKVNYESLQVVRYKSGGYYKPHYDSINDGNPRMYTMLIALNDDYEEGETEFPNLNKKYKLKAGDGLFFHTLDNYELVTSKALHGGKPVKSGEKWVRNLWIRKYPYSS